MKNENNKTNEVQFINFNSYVLPDTSTVFGKKYVLNGDNNSFFGYVKDRYNGSPTNSGIINAYVKFIIGEGLEDVNGVNIGKYISKRDLKLLCLDFKMYGQFSLKVIWCEGSELLGVKASPVQFKYINTDKIGLSLNDKGDVNGYWYSYDWKNQGKYKPQPFKKFDGNYDENNPIEIITFTRNSPTEYFPQCDYVSGLQYAELEEQLSNSSINYISNGFSLGRIINVYGTPPTDEIKKQYKETLINNTTGSENNNGVTVGFFESKESAGIEVQDIQVRQLDSQLVFYSEEAQRKLFIAHSVVSPLLFGVRDGSGLGSNKDEMDAALKLLYRSNINPMREEIIDSLEYLFKFTEDDVVLQFKDFEELQPNDIKNNEQL